MVYADPRRLRQVLRNLVSNAHRYGGNQIFVDVASEESFVALQVRDNGSGIPDELQSRVFEPYQTAHERVGVTGSVGLGLTVSRQLARLMGGDLTYHRVEEWSVFRLTLPAA
jgi:signal transduction histidine kinase